MYEQAKNAKYFAETYSSIRPLVEQWSDKIDQDVAMLRSGIEETKVEHCIDHAMQTFDRMLNHGICIKQAQIRELGSFAT